MKIDRFDGPEVGGVLERARRSLGEDVFLLGTRFAEGRRAGRVEVFVATHDAVVELRSRLAGDRRPPDAVGALATRPRVMALVGPAGAGKTTSLMKLALHEDGFGGGEVGLLTLDTHRVGALDQLGEYAEVAGLPLEVLYHADESAEALRRLRGCSVVLADTPGRAPDGSDAAAGGEWISLLRALSPDEVHLVIPATVRARFARGALERWADCGVTHILPSRLDELDGDPLPVIELIRELGLLPRWLAGGPGVPSGLELAGDRLLSALGIPAPAEEAGG